MEDPYSRLLVRVLSNEASPAERAELRRQVSASSARREKFEATRALWEATGAPTDGGDVDAAWERVSARIRSEGGEAGRRHLRLVADDARHAGAIPSRRATRMSPLLRIAAALLLVLGGALWTVGDPTVRAWLLDHTEVTGKGERAELTLVDGTHVLLGAESRLRHARWFGGEAREVYLEGTAYFDVAHDRERPFIVRSPRAVTRVLGTRFVVRDTDGSASARVVVVEGRVSVRHPGVGAPAIILARGQSARVPARQPVEVLDSVDVARELAWTRGRVELSNAPVREVLASVGQWYGVRLEAPDSSLAARHLTVSFGEEELETILREITLALGARVEVREHTIVLSPLGDPGAASKD